MLEGLTDHLLDLTIVIAETIKRAISKFLDFLFSDEKPVCVEEDLGPVGGEDEFSNKEIFEMSLGERDRNVFRRNYEVFQIVIPADYKMKLNTLLEKSLRLKNLTIENPRAVDYLNSTLKDFVTEVSNIVSDHYRLAQIKGSVLRHIIWKDAMKFKQQAA